MLLHLSQDSHLCQLSLLLFLLLMSGDGDSLFLLLSDEGWTDRDGGEKRQSGDSVLTAFWWGMDRQMEERRGRVGTPVLHSSQPGPSWGTIESVSGRHWCASAPGNSSSVRPPDPQDGAQRQAGTCTEDALLLATFWMAPYSLCSALLCPQDWKCTIKGLGFYLECMHTEDALFMPWPRYTQTLQHTGLRPKWLCISYLGLWSKVVYYGPWLKVVHYVGTRVPFGMFPVSLTHTIDHVQSTTLKRGIIVA